MDKREFMEQLSENKSLYEAYHAFLQHKKERVEAVKIEAFYIKRATATESSREI